ncbi:MAG: phosphoribosylglycinamide formyltransferase [Phycisphaerae bacterium]
MVQRSAIRLGILLSGSGRSLQNLSDCIEAGRLNARIAVVVSSRPGVLGLERARNLGLVTKTVDRRSLDDMAFQDGITRSLNEAKVDLVCMAGFLSLWRVPAEYKGRVMNIHPALLPEFGGAGWYGMKVHRAVLAAGKKESGCTVHFCNDHYDQGPIILQRRVPVLADDTPESLAARVFEQECIAYPQAIRTYAEGRLL